MCKKTDVFAKIVEDNNGNNSVGDNEDLSYKSATKNAASLAPTHSAYSRNTKYDLLIFLAPLLFCWITPVYTIYTIAILRIVLIHVILSLHYTYVDKDNYLNKLPQSQLAREGHDYLTATLLHMWVQVGLQIVFPSLFFGATSSSDRLDCAKEVLFCHVFIVEPLYYAVHRWLHAPSQMKRMHGFHHLSIRTLPTTSLVQNFEEHFLYIATFGPAFFIPFALKWRQDWVVICAYLAIFDTVNAWGHTNVRVKNWLFNSKYSPLTYLFYTPEFHLGHHAYFNANFSLFMPIWDHLMGTARTYKRTYDAPSKALPADQQDFVFIGHCGSFGNLLTLPEICVYNVYNDYKLYLPIKLEIMVMNFLGILTRLFISYYNCPRFCINNKYIGRIICICRTPYDYINPKMHKHINNDMLKLMRQEYDRCGTRYFGLGNLNKFKNLNDGGQVLVEMIKNDPYLHDKNIRVWTGDTMTVASVYHQIMDIPDLTELYYIGAGGKVGTAVCEMLVQRKPDLHIRIFSRNVVFTHPRISYSTDLSEMGRYKVVLIGKILSGRMYEKALGKQASIETRFALDYTVPKLPVPAFQKRPEGIQHIRIGLLQTFPNNPFLNGHYDISMGHPENHIVPCHFGCILNRVMQREEDEVGDIELDKVDKLWQMAQDRGFDNIYIDYDSTLETTTPSLQPEGLLKTKLL